MIRIAFPTNEKMSYLSSLDSTFDNSDYLTILNVKDENIVDVETIDNPYAYSKDGMVKICKKNKFEVLISTNGQCLPLKKLKKNGITVYKTDLDKTVLNAFNDFVQDKLEKVS